jgi:hypothetical protein
MDERFSKSVVANIPDSSIVFKMTLHRLIGFLAMGAWLAWAGVGCGGLNASQSVSPASFFLPGLLQNSPPEPSLDAATNLGPAVLVSQAR